MARPSEPSFVDDLIPLILDAQDHWWPRDFLDLALVSTSWLYYVRKRIYEHPRLGSFRNVHLLARTLRERAGLKKYIGGLSILPMGQRCRTWRGDLKCLLGVMETDDEDPVPHGARLRRVVIGGVLAIDAEQYLRLIVHPDQVEELYVDGSAYAGSLGERASIEWDEGLTCQFSGLRELRLAELDLDVVGGPGAFPLRVKSLVLEEVSLVGGTLAELLNGSTALEKLQVSTKEGSVYDEQIAEVLRECALGCVHYEVTVDKSIGDPFVLDVESEYAPEVRCVHLENVAVDAWCIGVIGTRFPGIEELVIGGRCSRVSSGEWLGLLSEGFKGLRRLVVPLSGWTLPEREGIAGLAVSRGIRLGSTCDK